MTLRSGWPAVSEGADQFDIRAAIRVDTALDVDGNIKTGVAITSASLSGLVTPRADMKVDVASFAATLDRHGPVKLYNDGVVPVTLTAPPSANSRIDSVYVMQHETASPVSDASDGPVVDVVTGVAGTSPVAPDVPDGALRLADILIPSTATSTQSDGVTVTQRYPFTASAGGWLQFRTEDDLNAWIAPDGYHARLLDGTEYVSSAGVWVSQTHRLVPNTVAGIFSELDAIWCSLSGHTMTISGSVNINRSWNPAAQDTILSGLPTCAGYQQQVTYGSQGKLLRLVYQGTSLKLLGDGAVADWPVNTHIYLNSTWIIQ